MSKEKALAKAGIKISRELKPNEINRIAGIISHKICESFPEYGISETDLFTTLSNVSMFLATFSDHSAAKYSYKDDSIYFKRDIDFDNLEASAVHECLHCIQTIRDNNGKLKRMGLYEPSAFSDSGLALNEAAVQLMASEATETKKDSVKYYGLEFNSESPNYYPIECMLVRQMTYFTGTYPLYHSTLYSNDIFKNTFIMKSSKEAYNTICKNLNAIVKYEETLVKEMFYYNEENINKAEKIKQRIDILKENIKRLTIETQETILKNCAYADLDLIRNNTSVREFKDKLYKFQKYLINTEGYTFYNDFYVLMMKELDHKRALIEKYGVIAEFKDIKESLSLIEVRQEPLNLFQVGIQKLKKLFRINQESKSTSFSKTNK